MTHGLVAAQFIHVLKSLAAGSDPKPFVASVPGFSLAPVTFRIPNVVAMSRKTYEALHIERGWYRGTPE
jgi:hypothetical protein